MPRRITVLMPCTEALLPARGMDLGQIAMLRKGDSGARRGARHDIAGEIASAGSGGWRKLGALLLALAAVGLPVNRSRRYMPLLLCGGRHFQRRGQRARLAWAAAVAIVAVAIAGQFLLAPPRIEEGHNVFLPEARRAGARPAGRCLSPAWRDEFDALYPPAVRCKPGSGRLLAGSAACPTSPSHFPPTASWHKPPLSRSVTALDFSDPVWLRLGFINENRYNWYTAAPDVHRADRDRAFWMGLHRWHLAMPWFEMIRLPAAFVGGELCWRGDMMWEGEGGHFPRWPGDGCRAIAARRRRPPHFRHRDQAGHAGNVRVAAMDGARCRTIAAAALAE